MKNITTSVLGFEVPVTNVPENLQEGIASAGGEGNLLEGWLNYIRFHRTNTEARAEVADRISMLLGVERKTKKVSAPTSKDPNNTRDEWAESEADFAKRAVAESGQTLADIAPQILNGFTATVDGKEIEVDPLALEFSATGATRAGGPRKVAQVYTKSANQLIALGPDKYNTAIAMLEKMNPGSTVARGEDNTPEVESLASILKVNKERVEKEALSALGL